MGLMAPYRPQAAEFFFSAKLTNGSVAPLPLGFPQILPVSQVFNQRAIVGNGRLHLLETNSQRTPYLAQTGNMLLKLALDLLDLLDSLVSLSRRLLGRLQKQLAAL